MDIYAKNGDRVVFRHPDAGYPHHSRKAKKLLKAGQTYTVERTDVGGFHTDVYLVEFPGEGFNSVLFEDAPTTSTGRTHGGKTQSKE